LDGSPPYISLFWIAIRYVTNHDYHYYYFICFKDKSGRFPFLSCPCAEYCGLYLLTFLSRGFFSFTYSFAVFTMFMLLSIYNFYRRTTAASANSGVTTNGGGTWGSPAGGASSGSGGSGGGNTLGGGSGGGGGRTLGSNVRGISDLPRDPKVG